MQQEKTSFHIRNKHRTSYDFIALIKAYKPLREFVFVNQFEVETIDFFNPEAVIALNKALLKLYYNIENWEIPQGYLCPPIPGRADYIHYAANLFTDPLNLNCLDIGVGANCIYPIIGVNEYHWKFVGSDIESIAVKSAKNIVEKNTVLHKKVDIRLQKNPNDIFKGIIKTNEKFDLTICNPPFHKTAKEAQLGNIKKTSNLRGELVLKPKLNFGGKNSELWCPGGELKFINDMIYQSKDFATQVKWFTTLVSKKENLKKNYFHLEKLKATDVRTIEMKQGNKTSRILAWTF